MSRILSASLPWIACALTLGFSVSAAEPPKHAPRGVRPSPSPIQGPQPESLSIEMQTPGGGDWTLITVKTEPKQGGVEVSFSYEVGGKSKTTKKIFGAPVLSELRRAWTEPHFDVSTWPADQGCAKRETWKVVSSIGSAKHAHRRVICRSQAPLARLEDFHAAIQSLLQ